MNRIEGLQLTGFKLLTEENFNSIPGLWQWNDSRERVEVETGVAFWGDKSSQSNNFAQKYLGSQPVYEKSLWIKSAAVSTTLSSSRRNYNFLHNGSKFGIYAIHKPTWSIAVPAQASNLITTGTVSSTGIQGLLSTSLGSGRAGMIIRGGATPPDKLVGNLLNPANANYSPSDKIYTHSIVNLGQTLGVKVTYGNAVFTSGPFFPTLPEYPTGNHKNYIIGAGAPGITVRLGLFLIYNWTGYTGTQVQGFDTRVRNLLDREKLNFQNLDI